MPATAETKSILFRDNSTKQPRIALRSAGKKKEVLFKHARLWSKLVDKMTSQSLDIFGTCYKTYQVAKGFSTSEKKQLQADREKESNQDSLFDLFQHYVSNNVFKDLIS